MKRLFNHAIVSVAATGALVASSFAAVGIAFSAESAPACDSNYTATDAQVGLHHEAVAANTLLTVKGLKEGATVAVKDASEKELKFQEPFKPKTDSITADKSGTASGHLGLIIGRDSVAGTHDLTVTVTPNGGAAKTCTLKVKTGAVVSSGMSNSLAAEAIPAPFVVHNLPEGAVVTEIKIGDQSYWKGTAKAVEAKGEKTTGTYAAQVTANKAIPAALVGKMITVVATDAKGATINVASNLIVSRSVTPLQPDMYQATCVAAMPTGGKKAGEGLFESAYNPKTGKLFVTYATFDAGKSGIAKLDAKTLKQEAFHDAEGVTAEDGAKQNESGQKFGSLAEHKAALEKMKTDKKAKDVKSGGYYMPFGIGLDNTRGYVWVTNSITDTVSLYKQSDLSLVKRWPTGSLNHGYDVIVPDEKSGIAYATDGRHNKLEVFNPADKSHDTIMIGDAQHPFASMTAMTVDGKGNLYLVSRNTPWGLKFNYASKQQEYFPLGEAAKNNLGVAYDTKHDLLYFASQDSSMVTAVDPTNGKVKATISVAAQPLRLSFDADKAYMHVISRTAGTIATIDTNTNKVIAQKSISANPNHITTVRDGMFFYVDKNPQGNKICRITFGAGKTGAAKPDTSTKAPVKTEPKAPGKAAPKASGKAGFKAAPKAPAKTQGKVLANTGSLAGIELALALALIAAGAVVVGVVRRRS